MFNSESLDDPLVFDSCESFAGGMVSNSRATTLRPDQSAILQNFDLTQTGVLTTRVGSRKLGTGTVQDGSVPYSGGTLITGLAMFNTPAHRYLVAANNRYLWKWNGTAWSLLNSGWQANASHVRVVMVQGLNALYIVDGHQNVFSWDGTAFADLGGGGASQPPVGATSAVWHTNRLIVGGMSALPDTVAFSGILDTGLWSTATQTLRVGAGDGDPIVGLCPWLDFNLLVIKRNSLWIINCDPAQGTAPDVSEFPIKCVSPRIGSHAPRTFVQVGSDVFGLTDAGVRSMRRTFAAETQSELGPSISFPIDDIISRITPAGMAQCTATYWNNRYLLSAPIDGLRYVLVYNTLTESWSGYWTGWEATTFASHLKSNGARRLVFGRGDGKVHEWIEGDPLNPLGGQSDYQDDQLAYVSSFVSRIMEFGNPVSPKTGMNLEVETTHWFGDMEVSVARDADTPPFVMGPLQDDPFDLIGSHSTTVGVSSSFHRHAYDLQSGAQFRGMQALIRCNAGGIAIRRLQASAFIDTMVLQNA